MREQHCSDHDTFGFTDYHAVRRSRLDPPGTAVRSIISRVFTRFPTSLGPSQPHCFVLSASPTSKPYSSYESVRTELSFPNPLVDTLLGCSPLEYSLLHLGTSNPPGVPGTRAHARLKRPTASRARLGCSLPN